MEGLGDREADPFAGGIGDRDDSGVWLSGVWLIEHHAEMDRALAGWLDRLARFDAARGWADDGMTSCVDWLVTMVRLGRATAFERLRVARELQRRPVVAEAFAAGRLRYSAVRVITRAGSPDPEVDRALVAVAEEGSVADVERAVRTYLAYQDQEREPAELIARRRGLRVTRCGDGLARVVVYLTDLEADELESVIRAQVERDRPGRESPRGDCGPDLPDVAAPARTVAPAPGDPQDGEWRDACAVEAQHASARRADALLELARAGALGGGDRAGSDRYLVHLVIGPDGTGTTADGTPVPPAEVGRIACDCSSVTHHHDRQGEPLWLGRRRRSWNQAQRRAALVRDGGTCRFPGCQRRSVDLHHQRWWTRGGRTDIDNGFLLCTWHHQLLHEHGYTVEGQPCHHLVFHRPDGRVIGATTPTRRSLPIPTG